MAFENMVLDVSRLSSGDMSANQFKAVQLSTTNAQDGAIVNAARGTAIFGVYQDNSTQSEAGRIRTIGITKILAGDSSAMQNAIAPGGRLVASSVGHAVPSTDTRDAQIGISLDSLSTGSTGIISMLIVLGATSTA